MSRVHRTSSLLFIAACWLVATSSHAKPHCPPETGEWVDLGWRSYRADSIPEAARLFSKAITLCHGHMDAMVGLGFTSLRFGRIEAADSLFRVISAADPANADAWEGRVLAASRAGDRTSALAAARALLALSPGHATARSLLDAESPGWDLAPFVRRARPATFQMPARTRGEGFEVWRDGAWAPFHIQGVNLGVALPGRFPSEFPPDSTLYAHWFHLIAEMNANTLRLYTILPPSFYRALRGWNLANPERPLWLVHGVWTELPPEDDFGDAEWKGEFVAEMNRVVDLIHGNCDITPRPGHARGRYDADVSPWTLAYIIGREWEPYAIRRFDEIASTRTSHRGRFLEVKQGTPGEVWMAEMCDTMLVAEWDRHHTLRPIAFTNWPTLDPLHHPTESSASEEKLLRVRAGRPVPGNKLEYDNDAQQLDPNVVRATRANPAGWFASYHAYPYYPDFMNQDQDLLKARSSEGPSNYFGYLKRLMRHHAGIPTVISEYGVPSSRGTAHLHPQGWHHGGHDEHAMAEIDARMTREIRESGAAGAIVFAWIDEWFKKNWAVIDLQIPGESTRQWLNLMDAEQNYGMLAMMPGDSASRPLLGGDPARWRALPVLQHSPSTTANGPQRLHVGSDEAWVYLAVPFENDPFGDGSTGVAIAFDTIRPDLGQRRIDGLVGRSEVGFEFLAEFESPDHAHLLVTPDYNPYAAVSDPANGDDRGVFYRRPTAPTSRDDARFDSMLIIVNRGRFARNGAFTRAQTSNRGVLRYGTTRASSLSDWYYDAEDRMLQLRLPWGLLNVTDPSSRQVLFDPTGEGDFTTAMSDGFRVGVLTYRKGSKRSVTGALPLLRADRSWSKSDFATWEWSPWTTPRFHTEIKPVYHAMKRTWAEFDTEAARDRPAASAQEER